MVELCTVHGPQRVLGVGPLGFWGPWAVSKPYCNGCLLFSVRAWGLCLMVPRTWGSALPHSVGLVFHTWCRQLNVDVGAGGGSHQLYSPEWKGPRQQISFSLQAVLRVLLSARSLGGSCGACYVSILVYYATRHNCTKSTCPYLPARWWPGVGATR